MCSPSQVAIITGGASGIGLAVAQALACRGGWQINLFDKDSERGAAAVQKVPNATFHEADVANYPSLAEAFETAFQSSGRLDFVFANAGIAMTAPVSTHDSAPPPEPNTSMIDINLNGAINTSQLAMHYLSKSGKGGNLVITASSAGFYASDVSPTYSASKHGVIGWTRSIAPTAMREHGIRVNAICPGIVKTNILPEAVYQMFPPSMLTPVSKVVDVVLLILDGEKDIEGYSNSGQTIEVCGSNHYFREQTEFCDTTMQALMDAGSD